MFRIYLRRNQQNGKVYVGVTEQTLDERWTYMLADAAKLARHPQKSIDFSVLRTQILASNVGHKTKERRLERLAKREAWAQKRSCRPSTIYDDILNAEHTWEHVLLVEVDDPIEAAFEEERQVSIHRANDPQFGYNQTPGGELPRNVRVSDVLQHLEARGWQRPR